MTVDPLKKKRSTRNNKRILFINEDKIQKKKCPSNPQEGRKKKIEKQKQNGQKTKNIISDLRALMYQYLY